MPVPANRHAIDQPDVRLVDRVPVCWDRHRSIVVENLRFRADLEYVAFLVNSLPVFISVTSLK